MREFNTSGPNIIEEHYTLERLALIEKGKKLVKKNRYFTIWAPRQTGKSTYFRLLAKALQADNYLVCHINFENYAEKPLSTFMERLVLALEEDWGISLTGLDLAQVFHKVEQIKDKKLVLIIDEVEGINAQYFGEFLHTIRNAYHSREKHGLKSVIFVGVSNITGVVQDNASPFNISDSLQVDYFTKQEVFELLEQHETETGQEFTPQVKDKIYAITVGQPGLVNGFAARLVEQKPTKPLIDYMDYLIVEDWYLYDALDKNVANVINKAKKYQKFLEELLFLDRKVRFDIDKEAIRFFYTNGLINKNAEGNVAFWVPLYKKRLQKYFYPSMNGEAEFIQSDIWVEKYLTADKQLDMDKIIREYQVYTKKRGFRPFFITDEDGNALGLREAALMYSFETYIQSFLEALKGKSYLEPHVGLGRSDLIINILDNEWVIEAKIFYNAAQYTDGKTQLAYYIKSLGLNRGIYLVFVNKQVTNPYILEGTEDIEGVDIITYIVRYDLEIDFSEPRKAKLPPKKKVQQRQKKSLDLIPPQ
jgi:AAA-like domain